MGLEFDRRLCSCGSKSIIHRGERWSIRCLAKRCGAVGPQVHTVEEAVAEWDAMQKKLLTPRKA